MQVLRKSAGLPRDEAGQGFLVFVTPLYVVSLEQLVHGLTRVLLRERTERDVCLVGKARDADVVKYAGCVRQACEHGQDGRREVLRVQLSEDRSVGLGGCLNLVDQYAHDRNGFRVLHDLLSDGVQSAGEWFRDPDGPSQVVRQRARECFEGDAGGALFFLDRMSDLLVQILVGAQRIQVDCYRDDLGVSVVLGSMCCQAFEERRFSHPRGASNEHGAPRGPYSFVVVLRAEFDLFQHSFGFFVSSGEDRGQLAVLGVREVVEPCDVGRGGVSCFHVFGFGKRSLTLSGGVTDAPRLCMMRSNSISTFWPVRVEHAGSAVFGACCGCAAQDSTAVCSAGGGRACGTRAISYAA